MFSLDRSKNDTSVTLDLLRAAAAQMVCIGHGIAFFYPPWRATTSPLMQNVGVLIFFVLSGILISFTLIERSKSPAYGLGTFWLERFARIYSGLVPALLLIAIIDGVTIHVFGATRFADYYTVRTFVANLLMLEAYRGVLSGLLQWSPFGSASVLWTLALEFHIYLFVAAGFFAWTRRQHRFLMIAFAIVFCQVPLYFIFGAYQMDGIGTGLFALWLAGAGVLASLKAIRLPYWTAMALVRSGPRLASSSSLPPSSNITS